MRERFDEKYFTLDLIPKYRLDFIALKLNEFIRKMNLKEIHWPMDCFKLMDRIKKEGELRLDYSFAPLDKGCDGAVKYFEEFSFYAITINSNVGSYPFKTSLDRRLNFTAAHELGHVVLGHADIPDFLKTKEDRDLEDLEADEFAGRFLMPEDLILFCNYYSLSAVAEYLMVSKAALWRRLNNLKMLHREKSKPKKTCTCCGNTKFYPTAKYCGVCGTPLSAGLNGIRIFHHEEAVPTDFKGRFIECPRCGCKEVGDTCCPECGLYMYNICSDFFLDPQEGCAHTGDGTHRYCEICGKPTYYFKKLLMAPWDITAEKSSPFLRVTWSDRFVATQRINWTFCSYGRVFY